MTGNKCVIKVLKPIKKKKVKREIKVLENLRGGPNIITLLATVKDTYAKFPSLILEYVETTDWRRLYTLLTITDIQYYTYQLLRVSSKVIYIKTIHFPFIH